MSFGLLLAAVLLLTWGMELVERDDHFEAANRDIAGSQLSQRNDLAGAPRQSNRVGSHGREVDLEVDVPPSQVVVRGSKIREIAAERSLTPQFVSHHADLPLELVEQLFASADVVLPLHVGERLATTVDVDLAELRCLPQ